MLLLERKHRRFNSPMPSTHFTTTSSSLDPDLARRFNSPTPHPPPSVAMIDPPQNPTSKAAGGHSAAKDVDQPIKDWFFLIRRHLLFLGPRFAALKGSLGPSDRGFQKSVTFPKDSGDDGGGGEGVSKEVDKVMQWAMDAARLDPSNSDDKNEEDETEEQQDEEEMKQVKNQGKGK